MSYKVVETSVVTDESIAPSTSDPTASTPPIVYGPRVFIAPSSILEPFPAHPSAMKKPFSVNWLGIDKPCPKEYTFPTFIDRLDIRCGQ